MSFNYARRREASPLLDISQISEHLSKLTYIKNNREYSFQKQAERLKNCNVGVNLFLSEDGFVEIGRKCNYKICPVCSKIIAWKAYSRYIDFLRTKRIAKSIFDSGLRHLILTIKNQEDIEKGIDKLYLYFRRFRRGPYANEKIKDEKRLRGGLGVLHIKKGKDELYNIHFHFIIDSCFLDMKSQKKKGGDSKMVQEWKKCTGGDGILQVKRVRDYGKALNYVLKYITREFEELNPLEIALFFKATFRRRLLFTFGNFYGVEKPKKKKKFQYISPNSDEYYLYHGGEREMSYKEKKRRGYV